MLCVCLVSALCWLYAVLFLALCLRRHHCTVNLWLRHFCTRGSHGFVKTQPCREGSRDSFRMAGELLFQHAYGSELVPANSPLMRGASALDALDPTKALHRTQSLRESYSDKSEDEAFTACRTQMLRRCPLKIKGSMPHQRSRRQTAPLDRFKRSRTADFVLQNPEALTQRPPLLVQVRLLNPYSNRYFDTLTTLQRSPTLGTQAVEGHLRTPKYTLHGFGHRDLGLRVEGFTPWGSGIGVQGLEGLGPRGTGGPRTR